MQAQNKNKISSHLTIADEGGQKNRNGKLTASLFLHSFLLVYIELTYKKEDSMFDMFGTNVTIYYDKVENVITIQQGKEHFLFNHPLWVG